jgi:hypothetical protein
MRAIKDKLAPAPAPCRVLEKPPRFGILGITGHTPGNAAGTVPFRTAFSFLPLSPVVAQPRVVRADSQVSTVIVDTG